MTGFLIRMSQVQVLPSVIDKSAAVNSMWEPTFPVCRLER